jgi:FhaA, N-terminal domain/FHA domain
MTHAGSPAERLGVLRGIEQRIESLFEGVFGRAFRSHVQPVELARKLVKEMDEHRSVSVSRVYVPNEYVVYLSPKDREQLAAYEESLLVELGEYLAEHARKESYALLTPPRVLMESDDDLAVGEFGIATRLIRAPAGAEAPPAAPPRPAAPIAETRVFSTPEPPPAPDHAAEPEPPARPSAVTMAGVRYELERPVLTIGRSQQCDITIEDAAVSRRHAEIRRENGAVWIVDLGSTNGTEVNGKRVDRAQLDADDRILIGQTELRFELAP